MKDLYTFDASKKEALRTYEAVRKAYAAFFDELKIPYVEAEAHSGDIGGDISHEFQFPSAKGEDVILSCTQCDYVINEELARDKRNTGCQSQGSLGKKRPANNSALEQAPPEGCSDEIKEAIIDETAISEGFRIWYGVTADRTTLVEAILPQTVKVTNMSGTISHWRETQACTNSIRNLFPTVDLSVERPVGVFKQFSVPTSAAKSTSTHTNEPRHLHRIIDHRVSEKVLRRYGKSAKGTDGTERYVPNVGDNVQFHLIETPTNLVKIAAGDPCPNCLEGTVEKTQAIELGHTFHLGTRYSKPLDACFIPSLQQTAQETTVTSNAPKPTSNLAPGRTETVQPSGTGSVPQALAKIPLQMGCHGIGISRMIAAVADTLADAQGLNWPRVMAPFEVVIVSKDEHLDQVPNVYKNLRSVGPALAPSAGVFSEEPLDVVVDDRQQSFVWKLKDADLIGYPVIVVLGKRYGKERLCEIQCRRLCIKENVRFDKLKGRVEELLRQL